MNGGTGGPQIRGSQITCHRFERQAADWFSRRLSPKRSKEMAAHEQACASCRRAAQAEAEMRKCFRAAAPPPALRDLWPGLALRLEAESPKTSQRRSVLRLPRRQAIAAAAALAALAFCWDHWPGATSERSRAVERAKTFPASALTASSIGISFPKRASAWPPLGNAAQDDPSVDDPIGPNMEKLWTCLNADSK